MSREGKRLTARRDKLHPFCLCQDEGREERTLTSEELRSKQGSRVMKGSERQRVPMNDKGGNQLVNFSQSNGHTVFSLTAI